MIRRSSRGDVIAILAAALQTWARDSVRAFELRKPFVDSLHARLLRRDKRVRCYRIYPATPVSERNPIASGNPADYPLKMQNICFDLSMVHSPLHSLSIIFTFLKRNFDDTRSRTGSRVIQNSRVAYLPLALSSTGLGSTLQRIVILTRADYFANRE
jgi:hypothetical protein